MILLRTDAGALELLLVKRSPAQRFMGGIWVFPGGAVDAGDGEGDAAHRAAAVRELGEEAGVDDIDPDDLVKYSRWITPEHIEMRFDTHFFLAVAPPGTRARCDGVGCVDLRWISPQGALDAHGRDELALVFATIKHLAALTEFASARELLAHARGRDVRPVLPRVVLSGGPPRIVLPGANPATTRLNHKPVQNLQLSAWGRDPILARTLRPSLSTNTLLTGTFPGVSQGVIVA